MYLFSAVLFFCYIYRFIFISNKFKVRKLLPLLQPLLLFKELHNQGNVSIYITELLSFYNFNTHGKKDREIESKIENDMPCKNHPSGLRYYAELNSYLQNTAQKKLDIISKFLHKMYTKM